MSMTSNLPFPVTSEIVDLKNKYLELIASGSSEKSAMDELDFPKLLYMKLMVDDPEFVSSLESARKLRAEIWLDKIIQNVDDVPSKDDVGGERLKFDKLQYLAKADNPEKFGTNNKKVDVDINVKQFKLLSPEEALKVLTADPFAIPAECEVVSEEDLL